MREATLLSSRKIDHDIHKRCLFVVIVSCTSERTNSARAVFWIAVLSTSTGCFHASNLVTISTKINLRDFVHRVCWFIQVTGQTWIISHNIWLVFKVLLYDIMEFEPHLCCYGLFVAFQWLAKRSFQIPFVFMCSVVAPCTWVKSQYTYAVLSVNGFAL